MSKENLDQFIQKVTDDKQLQARIGDEIDTDSLIALGAEHGFEFSVEDLQESAELGDEELDGVAGGANFSKNPLGFSINIAKSQVRSEGVLTCAVCGTPNPCPYH